MEITPLELPVVLGVNVTDTAVLLPGASVSGKLAVLTV